MDLDAELSGVFENLPDLLAAELGEDRVVELWEKDPERFGNAIERAISSATETTGQQVAENLKRDGPKMLARRRAERRGFEERLKAHWAPAFDLAEMVMVAAYEMGESFHEKHESQAEADNDLVFAVLVRLHARSCRIAEEVLTLLKGGFGQAAHTRWRALHEVAVVSSFISENGQDTAERYLLHEHIEAWNGMKELQAKAHRLDEEPFTDQEMSDAKKVYEELVVRYGKRYASSYGWAHAALVARNPGHEKKRTTIAAIEEAVSLDHLRPYYRMASHGTHANPKGILYTPDALKGAPDVLLAGPSTSGLAEPGQAAVMSLTLVTATLLTSKPGASAGLTLTALLRLTDEAALAYVDAQQALDDHRRRRGSSPVARLRHLVAPRLAEERARARQWVVGLPVRLRERATRSR